MNNVRRGREFREKRQEEAKARQESWGTLSDAEKIKVLDDRLGVGVGAHRQRSRLSQASKKGKRGKKS